MITKNNRREMKRDLLEIDRYQYLSQEDSDLYDIAKEEDISKEESRDIIMILIERIADATEGRHRASTY